MDWAVQADHRVEIKESEKSDNYLDLARELRKPSMIRMKVITIVIGALSMISKGLER